MTSATARIVPLHPPGSRDSGASKAELVLRVSTGARRIDSERTVAVWRGEIARQLLAAPALRAVAGGSGEYPCTQACLRQIVLAAAAVDAALERLAARRDAALAGIETHEPVRAGFAPEPLGQRLARLGTHLDGDARLVARVLFAHPGDLHVQLLALTQQRD